MNISLKKFRVQKPKWYAAAGVSLFVLLLAGVLGFGNAQTSANDCTPNAILHCGTSGPADFISRVKSFNGGNQTDLPAIYAAYGLTSADYSRFASTARAGVAYKDGRVVVDGRVVGTNGWSLGRQSSAHTQPVRIGSKTYYETRTQDLFLVPQLPVMVMFNAKGDAQTIVQLHCGNPVRVTLNNPTYACNALNATQVNRTTYSFSTSASAGNGATIHHVVYNFGDGTTVTSTSPTQVVSHNYAKEGSYNATVTVYVSVPGSQTYAITPAGNCVRKIVVQGAPGVSITKTVDGVKTKQVAVDQNFVYQLTVKNTGGVELKNAVVTDTPPQGVTLLSADKGTVSASSWAYTIPTLAAGQSMTFNITAKVPAQVDGSLVNTACVNAVEVNPNTPSTPDSCDKATVSVPPVVPKNPNINITKTVDGVKTKQVDVGQAYNYQLVVKNTGDVDLKNVVVTDTPDAGITLVSADKGNIAGNVWTYTIPALASGDSASFTLSAKVDQYSANVLDNKACVNAPEVNPTTPNTQDSCDTASVTVTPPTTPTPPVTPPTTPEVLSETTTLPNTGAGDVITAAVAIVIGMAISYRAFLRFLYGK